MASIYHYTPHCVYVTDYLVSLDAVLVLVSTTIHLTVFMCVADYLVSLDAVLVLVSTTIHLTVFMCVTDYLVSLDAVLVLVSTTIHLTVFMCVADYLVSLDAVLLAACVDGIGDAVPPVRRACTICLQCLLQELLLLTGPWCWVRTCLPQLLVDHTYQTDTSYYQASYSCWSPTPTKQIHLITRHLTAAGRPHLPNRYILLPDIIQLLVTHNYQTDTSYYQASNSCWSTTPTKQIHLITRHHTAAGRPHLPNRYILLPGI